MISVLRNDAKA